MNNWKIKITSSLPQLINKLQNITEEKVMLTGEKWVTEMANSTYQQCVENLTNQGRNEPPPLSAATLKIYSIDGNPDGSGIRDHISIEINQIKSGWRAIVGITKGKPTMIAKVQNHGCVITVSDKMRKFLAIKGIFLRPETSFIRIPGRFFWEKAITHAQQISKQKTKEMIDDLLN